MGARNMGIKKQLFLLLSLVLLGGGCAKQEGGVEPLVVAMELQYPPFEMSDAQGNPTGISVEMAYALGEYLDRPVKIENTAWVGLIPSLQSGKADIVISSMTINEERSKVVDFSIPYAASGLTLLIKVDSEVKDYQDLAKEGVKVGVKSGTTGALWAQKNLPPENIAVFEEVAASALEVSQGKVDAFIYDGLTNFEFHRNFPDTTVLNLANLPGTVGKWGMALAKGSPLKAKVDAFIREYRASGEFERLETKYMAEIKAVFEEAGLPSFFDID